MKRVKDTAQQAEGSAVTMRDGRAVRIRVHGGGANQSQPEPEESVVQVKQTATMISKQPKRWRMKNGGSGAGRCGRGWPEEAQSLGR